MTLVLRLSKRVARAAIAGDLAWSSALGEEMHVALTRPVRPPKGAWASYRATPDAWEALAAWCAQNGRVGIGEPRDLRSLADALLRAESRIRAELDRLAKHPAYAAVAVAGVDATCLPARRCGEGQWWPTTRQALIHSDGSTTAVTEATLEPRIVRRGGRVFTLWSADRDAPLALDPAER